MSKNPYLDITTENSTGRITINRPKALNALSAEMCRVMRGALQDWAVTPSIDRVIINAAPGRAFCAGGDVRALIPLLASDIGVGDAYFRDEYQFDLALHLCPKPVVVIANGLTMGGGAGVLLNASHPVITTAMDFSMPETAIGLFPDVGASLFLRHCPPAVAAFLGMTGWRIGAGDMAHYGIAKRVIDADAETAMIEGIIKADILEFTLDSFQVEVADTPLADNAAWITQHFSTPPQSIRPSLEGDNHPWAERVRHALDSRCPVSMMVTHRLLTDPTLAPNTVPDAIEQDYRLATRMLRRSDFAEGVRAVLIDKDNAPKWQPPTLAQVTQAMVDAIVTHDNPALLGTVSGG